MALAVARERPASTWNISAREIRFSNSDRSVPVSHACAPSARISSNRAARRRASRWAAISSRSSNGACPPRAEASSRAFASTIEIRSAFCSPSNSRAVHPLDRVPRREVADMWSDGCAPGFRIANPCCGETGKLWFNGLFAFFGDEPVGLSQQRELRRREKRQRARAGRVTRSAVPRRVRAPSRFRRPLRPSLFRAPRASPDRAGPIGAAARVAHRPLVTQTVRRMRRFEPERQPVEKTSPRARAVAEQPIHRGSEPHHLHDFAEVCRILRSRTVQMDFAPFGAGAGNETGSNFIIFIVTPDSCGDAPQHGARGRLRRFAKYVPQAGRRAGRAQATEAKSRRANLSCPRRLVPPAQRDVR